MIRYYLITGRVLGDDEDTAFVLYQKSEMEARQLFIDLMREREVANLAHDGAGAGHFGNFDPLDIEVRINTVAVSDTPINILYEGAR